MAPCRLHGCLLDTVYKHEAAVTYEPSSRRGGGHISKSTPPGQQQSRLCDPDWSLLLCLLFGGNKIMSI